MKKVEAFLGDDGKLYANKLSGAVADVHVQIGKLKQTCDNNYHGAVYGLDRSGFSTDNIRNMLAELRFRITQAEGAINDFDIISQEETK